MAEEYIQGWRPKGDRPKSQMPKLDYLHQDRKESSLHTPLTLAMKGNEPCFNNPDRFAVGSEDGQDDLPTDREAQLMCAPCPLLEKCGKYAETKHPAWGVWGAKVYGRSLDAKMKEGNDVE